MQFLDHLILYSKRPKSEHVRISDRSPSFRSKSVRTGVMSEIRTNLFRFQAEISVQIVRNPNVAVPTFGFRSIDLTLYYKTPKSERSSDKLRPECPKSERLLTEQVFVRISALSDKPNVRISHVDCTVDC